MQNLLRENTFKSLTANVSQFWPSLPGDLDNYLSCGECFELIQTKADGTDYAIGEAGYTPPILLEIVDSCPCNANPKWCCKFSVIFLFNRSPLIPLQVAQERTIVAKLTSHTDVLSPKVVFTSICPI
jgi:hypothetical protein